MKHFILFILLAIGVAAHAQNAPSLQAPDLVRSRFFNPSLSNGVSGHELLSVPSPDDHLSSLRLSDVQVLDSFYQWMWDAAIGEWQNVFGINNYEYNDDNLPETFTTQFWTGTMWVAGTRFLINYDGNNNQISQVEQYWNGVSWINSYSTINTYDGANNLLLQINEAYDGTEWVEERRQTFTYDSNNNLLSLTIEQVESNQWVNQVRYTYTYDGEGNQTSSLFEGWNGTQWENVNQSLFTYDSNGNQLTSVYQSWDTGGWLDVQRIISTYDGNNNRLSQTIQYWAINEWVNQARVTYTYDDNLVTEEFVDLWNGNEWLESNYTTYEYDDNGNNTHYLQSVWNGLAWVRAEEGSFSFDSNNNPIYQVIKIYTSSGEAIMSGDSLHFYYRTISSTGTIAGDNADILVYPNPGNGKVSIHSEAIINSVRVYNLQGQVVYVRNNFLDVKANQLDLSHAGKGLYYAHFVSAGKSYSKVIVIK